MEVAFKLARTFNDAFRAGAELGCRSSVVIGPAGLSGNRKNSGKRKTYSGRNSSSSSASASSETRETKLAKRTLGRQSDGGKLRRGALSASTTTTTVTTSTPETANDDDDDGEQCPWNNCGKRRIHSRCSNCMCSVHCRDAQRTGLGRECCRHKV